MAKIKDLISHTNPISNTNIINSDENSISNFSEMKLLKFEEKINNKAHYQQKTIKSLLNTYNNSNSNSSNSNSYKDSNIFRNIKTTINANCSNLITVVATPKTEATSITTSVVTNPISNNKCLKSLMNDSNKNLSVLVNSQEDLNKYNCTHCNRSYNDKEKLKRHINNTHKKEKKFECNICHKK